MAERGAHLRAVVNRKLVSEAIYTINYDRTCVLFHEFKAVSEGKAIKSAKEGDVVKLSLVGDFALVGVIGHIRANKALYEHGTVSHIPLVSSSDGNTSIDFIFIAHKKIDLSKLDHLFELYLEA